MGNVSSNLNLSFRALAKDGWEPERIAEEFGVSVESVQLALNAGRKPAAGNSTLDSLKELGGEGVEVIRNLMHDESVHPLVRLKAATYITDVAAELRAPEKTVTPDLPAAGAELAKVFSHMQNAYLDTLKRAEIIEVT